MSKVKGKLAIDAKITEDDTGKVLIDIKITNLEVSGLVKTIAGLLIKGVNLIAKVKITVTFA